MKLLDRVWDVIRGRHYCIGSEEACVEWKKRFIFFRRKRHPEDMGEKEISRYLPYPAM